MTAAEFLRDARAKGLVVNVGPAAQLPTVAPAAGEREDAFQRRVIDLAHARGWEVAHFRRVLVTRKDGSMFWETPVAADGKGFPDLELVRDRLIKAELKRESKSDARLSADQQRWRDRYAMAGVEWYCWRPSDWPEIERVLA